MTSNPLRANAPEAGASRVVPLVALTALALSAPVAAGAQTTAPSSREAIVATGRDGRFRGMEYRMLGPVRGGRVTAVAGVARRLHTFYMGATGGGVWKTTDAGRSWENVSDGHFSVGSIGALRVAPSDPQVVWAGTGSACIRGNVSTGQGVYRSVDGGRTWSFVGLEDAGQIGDLQVHPRNPDVAWIAALGHPFGKNGTRGVYRTRDGGRSWERVLFLNDSTGVVDLALNPENPRVLYAAAWSAERKPWTYRSGTRWADGAGIWKTADGGDTWEHLEGGLPTGLVGRAAVTVSPADPDRVWALLEAPLEEAGVWRSDDGGRSWTHASNDLNLITRPWYYVHIFAHPRDPNTVYVGDESFYRSDDGGRSFRRVDGLPHGDHHALWIHPERPEIMIEGNDGGATVTLNGGRSWSTQLNQATAQLYSVVVDDGFPYRVYAPQQDNSTISMPSRTGGTGVTLQYWWTAGGCETGPIALDPSRPGVSYAGCYGGVLERFDRSTGQSRDVTVYPEVQEGTPVGEYRQRYQWNAPLLTSRHAPDVVYQASNHVHRSDDGGHSWRRVSPDLTRDLEQYQGRPGGPIYHDITGIETYSVVFALAESPHDADVLWAGSNDGLVHVTRNGGETWAEVSPPAMPRLTTVNRIELSPHRPGTAYVAAYRYRMDDWAPYVYRTTDYGESWTRIADGSRGIPPGHPVRAVREDPEREGLLYAGTEFGVFVSLDDGGAWEPLQLDLPPVPVTDLKVHAGDLVVATQGRGAWILDDLSPIRQAGRVAGEAGVRLYDPRPAWRTPGRQAGPDAAYVYDRARGATLARGMAGENAPGGAILYYRLDETADGEVALEVREPGGEPVRRLTGLPREAGLHRLVWDLRYEAPDLVEDAKLGSTTPPEVVPGPYTVELAAGEVRRSRTLEIREDPRVEATAAELEAQRDLMLAIRSDLERAHRLLRRVRALRERAGELPARVRATGLDAAAADSVARMATAVDSILAPVDHALLQSQLPWMGDWTESGPEPGLTVKYAWLNEAVGSADAGPTAGQRERYDDLHARLGEYASRVEEIVGGPAAALDAFLGERGAGPLLVPSAASSEPTRGGER